MRPGRHGGVDQCGCVVEAWAPAWGGALSCGAWSDRGESSWASWNGTAGRRSSCRTGLREMAVQMVIESAGVHSSERAAIMSIAGRMDRAPETGATGSASDAFEALFARCCGCRPAAAACGGEVEAHDLRRPSLCRYVASGAAHRLGLMPRRSSRSRAGCNTLARGRLGAARSRRPVDASASVTRGGDGGE